jgi:hypothetical protein
LNERDTGRIGTSTDSVRSQRGHDRRGPGGEPSATSFIELGAADDRDRFAEGFDDLPEVVPGVAFARMRITSGLLVGAVMVYGQLADDGVIDLIGVSIEP